jgi:hypothetical protein
MTQTIPNATWTRVDGTETDVYQESGANTWVDVEDGSIVFGPASGWKARQMSGAAVDVSDITS